MESTAFEILVLPVSLSGLAAVAACWLVAAIAGWSRRLLFGMPEDPDGAEKAGPIAWDQGWRGFAADDPWINP